MNVLDLHGYTLDDAYIETLEFLKDMHKDKVKTVKVITGKGAIAKEFPFWIEKSSYIKKFEPRLALNGGSSGLEIIDKVIIKAKKLLKANGHLYIEIGDKQSHAVSDLLFKNGFKLVERFFDYTKAIRCIMSTKVI